MKKLIIVSIIVLTGCASNYKEYGYPYEKQTWRFCSAKYDGAKAGKGFCYITKECKKVIFWDKCKPKTLFCPFEPEEERNKCMIKYKLQDKVIIQRV